MTVREVPLSTAEKVQVSVMIWPAVVLGASDPSLDCSTGCRSLALKSV